MLEAQLRYPVFAHTFRDRPAPVVKRGSRRLFRIGEARPVAREMGRR
jgi:hypothetical protein